MKVRDQLGLCYAVQPVHHTALNGGYWGIYIAAGKDKVNDAISAIQDILENIRTKSITRAQFNTVKKMIMGQVQMGLQTNDDYASHYSIPLLHGLGLDFANKNIEGIQELEYDDFKAVIKKFLSKKNITIKVGSWEE